LGPAFLRNEATQYKTKAAGSGSLFDDTANAAKDPNRRYKATGTVLAIGGNHRNRGLNVFYSPDGINWTADLGNPLVKGIYNDIWDPSYDPLLGRYFIITHTHRWHSWTDVHGKKFNNTEGRSVGMVSSRDFRKWTVPQSLFLPDSLDEGHTQWYGAASGTRRGEYLIFMLKELRDDLTASGLPQTVYVPFPHLEEENRKQRVYGMGYTVLMWTRDGKTWHRDRYTDKFLEPDPNPQAWDHAHAWINSEI